MRRLSLRVVAAPVVLAVVLTGCGTTVEGRGVASAPAVTTTVPPTTTTSSVAPTTTTTAVTTTVPAAPPDRPGNPAGTAAVPAQAAAVDTSRPTTVIGDGTPAGCTSEAVVAAVAKGGVITFSCGPAPVRIALTATAKVRNDAPDVVLDGGGRVTLTGSGQRRVLYLNTCDQAQVVTTSHCQQQDEPSLTVQNIAIADGNSSGDTTEGGGGGGLFAHGGRLRIVNARFTGNRCDKVGPDLGGGAVRVLGQSNPVYVVGSTFSDGSCSNGGALSGLGVSFVVLNSVLDGNTAVGTGANPARDGTPGGGSGGAIYTDGNKFDVRIAGSVVEGNTANEGGGAVFFVSNDRSGTLSVEGSTLNRNTSKGFETEGFPGIFFLGAAEPKVANSTIR
ncbi:hypothetical protein [Saccharothrix violaceirubra]|uniref:Putative small secreted protein n=1 Tax=Saccharothrix violaceirubra TaxID=413306 RepID=A0A7W7WX00_9PSEU|nr:hypothetical protein [Saccharothrix violaceirubra]MBB4966616.1 putative small secreted protein [Saccharothrix violaceirubra]